MSDPIVASSYLQGTESPPVVIAGQPGRLTIQDRTWIFLAYGILAYVLSGVVTDDWLPAGPQNGLWFLSVIGMFAFRLLTSPFFPRPKDSLVAAGTGAVVLWAVDLPASPIANTLESFRIASMVFLVLVALFSFTAMVFGKAHMRKQKRRALLARFSYGFGVEFGKSESVFTPPALLGALAFQSLSNALILSSAWILLSVVHPLERAVRVVRRTRDERDSAAAMDSVGIVERIDDPGLIRVTLQHPEKWASDTMLTARLSDGRCVDVIPLFVQVRNAITAGTGLFVKAKDDVPGLQPGIVSIVTNPRPRKEILKELVGDETADLVGFVVEGSTIDVIRFEVAGDQNLREGYVVKCRVGSDTVSYQITGAATAEESFERNPRGTVLVTATQLGVEIDPKGFRRSQWSPVMNAPVFRHTQQPNANAPEGLTFGVVPGTNTWIRADFDALLRFHTAVLGTTGVGKTELVFDVIREGLQRGTKIACVDFTQEYAPRLADCNPQRLGFTPEVSEELSKIGRASCR